MAVQLACSLIALQPVFDKAGAIVRVTRLEETMNPLVRCMRIAEVGGERALDQPRALGNLAGFDVGPTEVAEEPPIAVPMRCQFFEQCQLRLVVIATSAESQQPEHAERQ